MHSFTITAAFAGLLALASAIDIQPRDAQSDHVEKLCFPNDKQGKPDLSAPCNQQESLIAQGVYGKSFDAVANSDDQDNATPLSNKTQQAYFCGGKGSQIWDLTSGCMNCERLHGDAGENFPSTVISMVSSAYCAGGGSTIGMTDYLFQFAVTYSNGALLMAAQTATAPDVLGSSKTAVSYYYTPASTTAGTASATGSASASAKDASGSASATKTSSGSANGTSNGTSTASSTAKSTGAAGALRAAAGGVVAMAGAAAVVLML